MIRETLRGKRIGDLLLKEAEDWSRDRRFKLICLTAPVRLKNFYKRNKYEVYNEDLKKFDKLEFKKILNPENF